MSTSKAIKVSKSNATIRAIVAACFPDYRGRTVKVAMTDGMPSREQRPWDGGTHAAVVVYNLRTGGTVVAHDGDIARAPSEDWIVVEHAVFCGNDCGVTIFMLDRVSDEDFSVALDAGLAADLYLAAALTLDRITGISASDQRYRITQAALAGRINELRAGERKAKREAA